LNTYFNLAIDENDTSLGFATQWIETIAKSFDQVDVVTLKKVSEIKFSENINIYGPNEKTGKFIKYLAKTTLPSWKTDEIKIFVQSLYISI